MIRGSWPRPLLRTVPCRHIFGHRASLAGRGYTTGRSIVTLQGGPGRSEMLKTWFVKYPALKSILDDPTPGPP